MQMTHPPSSDSSKRKNRRFGKKRAFLVVIQLLLLLGFMGVFLAGGTVIGYVAALVKDEPVRSKEDIHKMIFTNFRTGFAYFNDGSLIGQMRAEDGDRRLVKKSDVSPYLINAIIATEDNHFYEHNGVRFQSTMRAAYQEFTHQPVVTGGSTLTQQLVKNTILNSEVTHSRKAKEIFSALRIERMFSKDQILEAYMNEIYYGKNVNSENIYGVQAAAKGIFDKDVKDLDLSQSSYLAGMIQNPGGYSPFNSDGYERGKERQKLVLDAMLVSGYVTNDQYQEALSDDLRPKLAKPSGHAYSNHPFLMAEIEERAARTLADNELLQKGRDKETVGRNEYRQLIEEKRREILRNGYKIYTTINKDVNKIMQDVGTDPKNFGKNATYTIRRANGKTEKIENALEETGAMMIQNKTGAILGMIGGRDFNVEQTNHATAPRQPGSAMKPLAAYGPAFELGYLQPATAIDDSPLLLADGQNGSHLPVNWDYKYHGMMSAREALRMSWNVPAIKTYLKVGVPTALDYVKKMGVTTLVEEDNHASTGVIGGLTYGLTAEEITNAYATFANRGNFIDAYLIDRIEDNDGKVVYKHEVQPVPVFSEQTSYLITDMMRTVVNAGTGTRIRKYVPRNIDVAGKTGTTNSSNDLWFVGYTPELSMGVWVGYDQPHPMPDSEKYRPMDIWGKVMKQVVESNLNLSLPTASFQKPDGILNYTVDSKSGLLPSELTKQAGHLITDIFNRQFLPSKVDDSHQKAKVVILGENRYLAKEGTPADFVSEGIFFKSPEPLEITAAQIQSKNRKASARPSDWDQRLPDKEDPRTEVPGAPASPSSVILSRSNNQVVLSWKSGGESDLLGYRLYRANASNGFSHVATIKDAATLTYTDSTANGGEFGYYLTAVDITGQESQPSTVVSTGQSTEWELPLPVSGHETGGTEQPPADNSNGEEPVTSDEGTTQPPAEQNNLPSTPQEIHISKTSGGFRLVWQENSADEQVIGYNIYYTPDPVNGFTLLDTVSAHSYVHKTNESGGWYYVTAVNSFGESPPSGNVTGDKAE